jgi:hypothetical protein
MVMLLMIALSGWSLVKTKLTASWWIGVGVISAAFCGTILAMKYDQPGQPVTFEDGLITLITVCFLILSFLGGVLLVHGSQDANRIIKAHLLTIHQRGIDPTTTPVYEKHLRLKRLQVYVFLFFILMMGVALYVGYGDPPDWVVLCAYFFVGFVLLVFLVDSYRPHGTGRDQCFEKDEEEIGDRDHIKLNDVNAFQIDEHRHEGLVPWNEDMTLPLEPVVMKSDHPVRLREDSDGGGDLTEPLMQGDADGYNV